MVEEIFTSGSSDTEENLANLLDSKDGNEDSKQIIKTLAVINFLKVTVLVIIGFIISKLLLITDLFLHLPTFARVLNHNLYDV